MILMMIKFHVDLEIQFPISLLSSYFSWKMNSLCCACFRKRSKNAKVVAVPIKNRLFKIKELVIIFFSLIMLLEFWILTVLKVAHLLNLLGCLTINSTFKNPVYIEDIFKIVPNKNTYKYLCQAIYLRNEIKWVQTACALSSEFVRRNFARIFPNSTIRRPPFSWWDSVFSEPPRVSDDLLGCLRKSLSHWWEKRKQLTTWWVVLLKVSTITWYQMALLKSYYALLNSMWNRIFY